METKVSPARELLLCVWYGVCDNKALWSWARLNRCMQTALHLAIEAGLKFDLDDFAYIARSFRWGHWAGDGEGFYCHAVAENSMPCIKAFEHYHMRKPFIVDDVAQWWDNHYTYRNRGRLAVNSTFTWRGERVAVTSFNDKKGELIACSYKPREKDERGYLIGSLKIKHVYKLTHKDLKRAKAT